MTRTTLAAAQLQPTPSHGSERSRKAARTAERAHTTAAQDTADDDRRKHTYRDENAPTR